MDGIRDYQVKQNKPEPETQLSHFLSYEESKREREREREVT
jgi:hypothetical protein